VPPHTSRLSSGTAVFFLLAVFLPVVLVLAGTRIVLASSVSVGDREFIAFISRFPEEENLRELAQYESLLEKTPDNLACLWRIAYLHVRLGWLSRGETSRKKHFFKALDYAQRAFRLAPHDYYARFVLCAARAKTIVYVPAGEKVRIARELKEYTESLLRLRKDDPDVWYMIGWWNYEIATLSLAKKMMASVLFGGLPGGASLEKAIASMKRAITFRPDYCIYPYDLGCFYQKQGQIELARCQYRKVLQMKPLCREEFATRKKARRKLRKLGVQHIAERRQPSMS
jgi:tetratricopeptide (TPR) repeat protein